MKEQKLVPVMAYRGGSFGLVNDSDGESVEALLAGGWRIQQMACPGPESFVVLLLERDAPKEPAKAHAGPLPFG